MDKEAIEYLLYLLSISKDFGDNKVLDGVKVGLSKGKVREIGKTLGADKIIRG
ncbi:MAG: hypothetical protein P9M13_02720 [Candidatus Ancaeobacter aquaticus]|nr:hypothetical protein [Candidatus Ancaeobacter aquaticus]